jgi:dsDNA-specific endonuclease/ATPase MutS2
MMDARTLDVLDFDAVRTLLARETSSDRAAERARAMVPTADLAAVRLEQAATVEMRRIASDAKFDLPRTREVGDAIELAARGGVLGAEDLRDVGFALAAADAAVRRFRRSRPQSTVPSANAVTCSIARRPRSRAFGATPRSRKTRRANASKRSYARRNIVKRFKIRS